MLALVLGRELRCELDGERTHDPVRGGLLLDGRDIAADTVRRAWRPTPFLVIDESEHSAADQGRQPDREGDGAGGAQAPV
jgi:hypothetical protein